MAASHNLSPSVFRDSPNARTATSISDRASSGAHSQPARTRKMVLLHCVSAEEAFKASAQNVFSSRRVWIAWCERKPSLPNSRVWEGNANPVLKLHIREEKNALQHWQQS